MNQQPTQQQVPAPGDDQAWLASRPALRRELQFSLSGKCGRGYLVEDPIRSRFYQVGRNEFAFMSLLDGQRTVGEALEIMLQRNDAAPIDEEPTPTEPQQPDVKHFDEAACKTICAWLIRSCLVNNDSPAGSDRLVATADQKHQQKIMSWMNPICVRLTLLNPNRLVSGCRNLFGWMFSSWFAIVWCAIAIWAAATISGKWDRLTAEAAGILAADRWIWLLASWILLKVIHEAAHGVVCRKYGGDVRQAGVLLLLFAPLAFVDVTSSWRFRDRWQRIKVAAAGMYIELFVAAVAILIWSSMDRGTVSDICYNVFVMAGITTILFNANPLMRFDGYYIMSDVLGVLNLYSKGQLWLRNRVQFLMFGIPRQPLVGGVRERWIVRIYGVCSFVWRILLSASILLTASTMFHGFGLIFAVIGTIFWFGLPVFQMMVSLFQKQNRHLINVRHLVISSTAALAALIWCFFVLQAPAYKSAPAIVQYQDEEVIRASAEGFVERIHIQNGQRVEKNQLLVELANPEISLELTRLRTSLAQTRIEARVHHEKNEIPKYQAAKEKCIGLQEQIEELEGQQAGLQIRSPINGFAHQPELENRMGSFVKEGDPVVTVSMKDAKEILVSIEQSDLESVRKYISELDSETRYEGRPVQIAFPGLQLASCRINRLDPQASDVPLHESLCAVNGGPIPVGPSDDSSKSNSSYRLLSPRFTATIELNEDSGIYRSGQRGYVLFPSDEQSMGSYLFLASRNWIRRQVDLAMGK